MKNMHSKYFKSAVLVLISALVIASCSDTKPSENQLKTKPAVVAQVQAIHPIQDQPEYSLSLPGELKPYEEVTLFPKVKGFVKKIFVDRGSRVKKGQLLAILEAPEITQRYLSARSDENKSYEDYLYSRQAYERLMKASSKEGAVAAIELDQARSKLRSDSAAYASVKANTGVSSQLQQYLKITAPFDGTVTDKNVSVGALVGENMPGALFSIAQTSLLRLTVAIPEKHAQSIGKNTRVSFTVSGHPGKTFHSSLSRKAELLQQEFRAVTAEFDVFNKDHTLGGGEFAQVKISMQRPDTTFWVPAGSIVHAQSGVFINKVENNIVKRIPVTEGIAKGNLREIFGDITTTDQIVKKASEELPEGTAVAIREEGTQEANQEHRKISNTRSPKK